MEVIRYLNTSFIMYSGIFITADHRSGDRLKMTGDRENLVLADQFDRQTLVLDLAFHLYKHLP